MGRWILNHWVTTKETQGLILKSNMETYITVCKIDSQWECTVWLRKLKRALYQPRGVGWGGTFKREGIYVYLWLIHVEV